MTQGIIYMVDGEGLRRMRPSAPESEHRMQMLVARYPELITDGDGDLLLIRREQPVTDGEAANRWSLDHLFVTREGVPVFVELKRASDNRLRREVVGQMLDYAANATTHWQAGVIVDSFTRTAGIEQAESALKQFIGDREPEEFWRQVDSNLKAGRVKLVFVADSIPRELAVIVEFLNDQMRADVRAVELRWFSDGAGVTTLSPRIIGEIERAAAAKSAAQAPMELSDWITERIAPLGEDFVRGVERFLGIIEHADGSAYIPATRGSIVTAFATADGRRTNPFGVGPHGLVRLSLGYLKYRPAFVNEAARKSAYDRLAAIVGPLSTKSLAGDPGFAALLLLDDAIASEVAAFVGDVVDQAARVEGPEPAVGAL